MSASVAREVVVRGTVVLLATLVLLGVGTAAVLYVQQVRGLDQALLAAAHARGDGDADAERQGEHSRAPVEIWLSAPGDSRVPPPWRAEATRSQQPLFRDLGDERLLLISVEAVESAVDESEEEEAREADMVVAARAPRVTLARSVGPFAVVYGVLAVLVALAAAGAQYALVRRAFRPIDLARDEAARVVGLGQGARLTESGPIEIRALLEAMNAVLDRLDQSFRAQVRFTDEAAHELRTPVTVMLGEVELALRRSRSPEEYRLALGVVREEVERLRQVVEGLTALARLDAGQIEQVREQVRASSLVQRALAAERPALETAGCRIRVEPGADPEVRVHAALVGVALGNLLRNAAAYAPGSDVAIRVAVEADKVAFIVHDGGPGIAPAEREAVFDRFTRTGEGRRRNGSGLGLGLSLAREVARRHGGDCRVADAPGGGCQVVLTIFSSSAQDGVTGAA